MMNINVDDIISFALAIMAVVYTIASMVKTANSVRRSKQGLPDSRDNDDDDEDEEAILPATPKVPQKPLPVMQKAKPQKLQEKFEFHSSLEDFKQKSAIEDRKLAIQLKSGDDLVSESLRLFETEGVIGKRAKSSPIQQLIKSLPQEKLLFLSYEVFHVPVCHRKTPFPWNG